MPSQTTPQPTASSSLLSKLALFHQNDSEPLTPVQLRVAAALARGLSVSRAAAENGLHRTTVHAWQRSSPAFDAAVATFRAEALSRSAAELRALAALALATLRTLLESPSTPAAVRLRAALATLRGDLLPASDLLSDWAPATGDGPLCPEAQSPSSAPLAHCRVERADRPPTQPPEPSGPASDDNLPLPPEPVETPHANATSSPALLQSLGRRAPKPEATPVARATAATPRNAPCPCGSGRKFKRCCGQHAPPVLHSAA